MNVIQAFNLLDCAGVADLPHYSQSAEALYRMIYGLRISQLFDMPYTPEVINDYIPEGDFSYHGRQTKESAQLIWNKVLSGEWPDIELEVFSRGYTDPGGHSEALIAVDNGGNVAVVCHTINVDNWGNCGIFVGGVSAAGAASEQQIRIQKTGPGNPLPDTTNPVLVTKEGSPYLAASCIGSDLHTAMVQNVFNVIQFHMSTDMAFDSPKILSLGSQMRQRIPGNVFPQALLDAVQAMGIPIELVDDLGSHYWIGVRLHD
jgi:gamma-glutamyltranspeptidase/glutathione hydrolase